MVNNNNKNWPQSKISKLDKEAKIRLGYFLCLMLFKNHNSQTLSYGTTIEKLRILCLFISTLEILRAYGLKPSIN